MIKLRILVLISVTFLLIGTSITPVLVGQEKDKEVGPAWTLSRKTLEEKKYSFVDAGAWIAEGGKHVVLSVTGEDLKQRASAQIFEIAEDFSELKLIRNLSLANPVKPMFQYLTPDARFFVTLDEAGTCGSSSRDLVIYDLAHSTVKARRIDDFLSGETLAQLEGPVYMGGDGLREWVNFSLPDYDKETMTLYPTAAHHSRLVNQSSKIPFLAIDLLTAKVKVFNKDELNDRYRTDDRSIGYSGADWGTKDGTQTLSDNSNICYVGLIVSSRNGEPIKQVQAGYELNPRTGNYRRIDWQKFLTASKSTLGTGNKK